MKKGNYLDYKTKSPDPDDLASDQPHLRPADRAERPGSGEQHELRPNPDASAPHIPPPEDD
jgi:hypothetical protein